MRYRAYQGHAASKSITLYCNNYYVYTHTKNLNIDKVGNYFIKNSVFVALRFACSLNFLRYEKNRCQMQEKSLENFFFSKLTEGKKCCVFRAVEKRTERALL